MRNYLKRKCPVNPNTNWLKVGIVAALIVFLVLFLFEPFGISFYRGSQLWICLLFASVTFVLTSLYGALVFNPIARHVKGWRIWHLSLTLFFLLFVISLGNVGADILFFHHTFSLAMLAAYIVVTFIVGTLVTAVITTITYQRYLRSRLDELLAKDLGGREGQSITFHDDSVKGEDLTIAVNDFLYAEVIKNNIIIYYVTAGKVETHTMRMTLQSLVGNNTFPNIIQCHRSFVINVDNITSAKGNSNGYKLLLGNCENVVPVSRAYVPVLKSFIA